MMLKQPIVLKKMQDTGLCIFTKMVDHNSPFCYNIGIVINKESAMKRIQYDAKLPVDSRWTHGGLITIEDNGNAEVRLIIERIDSLGSWHVDNDAMIPRDIAYSLVANKQILHTEVV
jgi:hypothetical protein